MNETQFELFQQQLRRTYQNSPFYRAKFMTAGLEPGDIKTMDDFYNLPFTDKAELRSAYPLGLMAVDESEVVRIHSTSGTTGEPVIIPYTAKDVADWAEMFARCYAIAGVTNRDRVQITPGYGLWTAGIGFQAGCEKVGAMAVPMGPGNTEKQLKMMIDLKTTVLTSTSSYALVITELIEERKLHDKIALKKGIIGSERWGQKMRDRISVGLGIELFDIYGLTEIYGPGISIDCPHHQGLHYFDDYLYFEIVDPVTNRPVPMGEQGELVITTLQKQGAPLIRYKTHDISRLIPGQCECGLPYPRHDRIVGRTDDMVKVKGVNIYPGQIDELLRHIKGVSSEYQVIVDHADGKDRLLLKFELEHGFEKSLMQQRVMGVFKEKIGIRVDTLACGLGELPRSEKKTKRIFDER